MYWRFGFHNTSSIDTLLDKTDVAVEAILDEDDLLQECKSQNNRLVEYLQRPDVLRTLLGYVTGDIEGEPHTRFKYPYLSTEVLCSDIWSIVESCLVHADQLLSPFWRSVLDRTSEDLQSSPIMAARFAKVNSVFLSKKPVEMLLFIKSQPAVVVKLLKHIESPAIVDLLFRLVKSDSQMEGGGAVEWLASQNLIARLVALLSPFQTSEVHGAVADLLKDIISISSPAPGNVSMNGASNDIAQDVSISNRLVRELAAERNSTLMVSYMLGDALDPKLLPTDADTDPPSSDAPSSLDFGTVFSSSSSSTSRQSSSIFLSGSEDSIALSPTSSIPPSVVPPASYDRPDPQSAASSLTHSIGIVIELIRKNHSDYYEPVLFHTLRNRLIGIQQGQAREQDETSEPTEQQHRALEDAMTSLAESVGIVHLGHIVSAVSARLPEFQELLKLPRMPCVPLCTTTGPVVPLTFERLRICELYAELFHTSNMALLNRSAGEGPSYDSEGRLQGGLKGLGELAKVAASGVPEFSSGDRESEDDELQEARELPVSSAETSSVSGDDDFSDADGLEDVSVEDESERTPPASQEVPVPSSSLGSQSPKGSPGATESSDDLSIPDMSTLSLQEDPFGDPEDATNGIDDSAEHMAILVGGVDDVNPSDATPGDRLKQSYLDLGVLNTLLDLFFDFPSNNFLHLVVYDLVHQILTGQLEGVNRKLIINAFRETRLVYRILDHQPPDAPLQKQSSHLQAGYQGHLMLMADDVITALEHFPLGLREVLYDHVPEVVWSNYVARHRVAKEQANKVLGGSRPVGGGGRASIFAQIDEVGTAAPPPQVGGTACIAINTDASRVISRAPSGSNERYGDADDADWNEDQDASFEDTFPSGIGAISRTPLDDDDDDEWGAFSSTSDSEPPVAFDDMEYTFPASESSISERVLTIADLNSSFHATIKANGPGTLFSDEWPPNEDDAGELTEDDLQMAERLTPIALEGGDEGHHGDSADTSSM